MARPSWSMGVRRYDRPDPCWHVTRTPRADRAVPSATLRRPRQAADGRHPGRPRWRAGLSCHAGHRPRRWHRAETRCDLPDRLDDQAGHFDRVHATGRGRQSRARRSGGAGDPRVRQSGRVQRRRRGRPVPPAQAVRGDADGRSDVAYGGADLRVPEPHQRGCRLSQDPDRRRAQHGRVRLVHRRAGENSARVRAGHRVELLGCDRRAWDRGLADRRQAAQRGVGRAHFCAAGNARYRVSPARSRARAADRLLGL